MTAQHVSAFPDHDPDSQRSPLRAHASPPWKCIGRKRHFLSTNSHSRSCCPFVTGIGLRKQDHHKLHGPSHLSVRRSSPSLHHTPHSHHSRHFDDSADHSPKTWSYPLSGLHREPPDH